VNLRKDQLYESIFNQPNFSVGVGYVRGDLSYLAAGGPGMAELSIFSGRLIWIIAHPVF